MEYQAPPMTELQVKRLVESASTREGRDPHAEWVDYLLHAGNDRLDPGVLYGWLARRREVRIRTFSGYMTAIRGAGGAE